MIERVLQSASTDRRCPWWSQYNVERVSAVTSRRCQWSDAGRTLQHFTDSVVHRPSPATSNQGRTGKFTLFQGRI